jgi:hypothetical protein
MLTPRAAYDCHLQESNKQLEQTTVELQGEKLRLDALLVRQYNLIAVLGKPRARGGTEHNGSGDSDSGVEGGSQQSGSKGLTLGERSDELSICLVSCLAAFNSNEAAPRRPVCGLGSELAVTCCGPALLLHRPH